MRTYTYTLNHPAFSCQRIERQGNEKVWSGLEATEWKKGTQEWKMELREMRDPSWISNINPRCNGTGTTTDLLIWLSVTRQLLLLVLLHICSALSRTMAFMAFCRKSDVCSLVQCIN